MIFDFNIGFIGGMLNVFMLGYCIGYGLEKFQFKFMFKLLFIVGVLSLEILFFGVFDFLLVEFVVVFVVVKYLYGVFFVNFLKVL